MLESFVMKKERKLTDSVLNLGKELKRTLVRHGFNGSALEGQQHTMDPNAREQVIDK